MGASMMVVFTVVVVIIGYRFVKRKEVGKKDKKGRKDDERLLKEDERLLKEQGSSSGNLYQMLFWVVYVDIY